jgi:crossover junction endodeoxyribonuclease RuvC
VRVIGIDPGATGALAFLTIAADGFVIELECLDMPVLRVGKRSHVDGFALAREIDARLGPADEPVTAAIIEQGGVRPQNGRVGAATFWLGLGIVRGVLAAHFVPIEITTAAHWKRSLRVTGDKDASRLRASAIFPRFAAQWSRAKDHGRAEAALIGLHGFNQLPVRQARTSA